MSKVRHAIAIQIGGLVLVAALFLVGGHFFPIADWIAYVQQKIMHLGFWSAIWYPLLYACCNVLLLPGGLLSCLLYTSPSPRDGLLSRMPSSA